MPKPEHIAALARVLDPGAWDDNSDGLKSELRRAAYKAQANRVLAAIATDPAVQDAVLAALVEGGRLVEEPDVYCLCGHHVAEHASDGCRWQWSSVRCACTILRPHRVRLVEPEWREATP